MRAALQTMHLLTWIHSALKAAWTAYLVERILYWHSCQGSLAQLACAYDLRLRLHRAWSLLDPNLTGARVIRNAWQTNLRNKDVDCRACGSSAAHGADFSLINPDHPWPGASSPVQFVEQAVHIAAACSPHRNRNGSRCAAG